MIYISNFSPKKPKYGNRKTTVDGHTFDSNAEAQRYQELKLMKSAGNVRWFSLQPSFLLPGDIRYRPDFIVCDASGAVWVEDVKGMETKEFKLKQKLWESTYDGFELRIVKAGRKND